MNIYNLAAMSHVKVSFENPLYTADDNGIGALRILEAVRLANLKNTRIYQASTAEILRMTQYNTVKHLSSYSSLSPYSIAKLYAYWITINYREALWSSCG